MPVLISFTRGVGGIGRRSTGKINKMVDQDLQKCHEAMTTTPMFVCRVKMSVLISFTWCVGGIGRRSTGKITR